MKNHEKKNQSKKKLSITSNIYIIFVLIILVLVNVIANFLPLKVDFSSNKAFTLSDESKTALDSIGQEIDILVCQDRANYNGNVYLANIAETLEDIDNYKSNVSLTFMSIDKNPEIAQEYPTVGLSTSSIIVRLANNHSKFKVLDATNLFDVDSNTNQITQSKVEYLILSAMDYVCRDTFPVVSFISNHVEDYPTSFASILSGNNYVTEQINLLVQNFSDETEYVVICNPKTDYSSDEIKKIDSFLQNDGKLKKNLMVFMSPEQGELPNLEAYLKEWGIEVMKGYIYNSKYSIDNSLQPMIVDFSDTESSGNLYRSVQIVTNQTRPLNLLFDTKNNQRTLALLSTASETMYVSDPFAEININADSPIYAPLVAVGTRTIKNSSAESHVIVSGSTKIISDEYIKSTFGNSRYFLQIIDYFSGNKSNFIIYPKNMAPAILNLNNNTSRTFLFILFVIIIPGVIALAGVIVYLKRRHL